MMVGDKRGGRERRGEEKVAAHVGLVGPTLFNKGGGVLFKITTQSVDLILAPMWG